MSNKTRTGKVHQPHSFADFSFPVQNIRLYLYPFHVIAKTAVLDGIPVSFKPFKAKEQGCLFFSLVVNSGHAQIIIIVYSFLYFCQNQMSVVIIAVQQETVLHHFLIVLRQDYKIAGSYG